MELLHSSNTFITFNSDFISDLNNNNSVAPVPDNEAMENCALVVSFDEGFIPESVNSSQIFIQNGPNAESSQSSFIVLKLQ